MKVLCPRHNDTIPSVEVYDDHAYCYAGCGNIPLNEIGVEYDAEPKDKYREDLPSKRDYISTLPMGIFRQFEFPFDQRGFYICWPDTLYYKQRIFDPGTGPKYRNPAGHSQPVYKTRFLRLPKLLIVEGEINSMSLSLALPEWDVISPGSASDFMAKKSDSLYTSLPKYDKIVIMTDRDAAGTAAAIYAKSKLLTRHKSVGIILADPDANQLHADRGIQALRDEVINKMSKGL